MVVEDVKSEFTMEDPLFRLKSKLLKRDHRNRHQDNMTRPDWRDTDPDRQLWLRLCWLHRKEKAALIMSGYDERRGPMLKSGTGSEAKEGNNDAVNA